jgi:hypothetical protein
VGAQATCRAMRHDKQNQRNRGEVMYPITIGGACAPIQAKRQKLLDKANTQEFEMVKARMMSKTLIFSKLQNPQFSNIRNCLGLHFEVVFDISLFKMSTIWKRSKT